MPATDLPQLATRLDRPVDSFPALEALSPPHLGRLCAAIERSLERHDRHLDASVPWFLRPLLGRERSP